MMVAKGQETAGNGSRSQMNDTSRPCAGASLSAAAAAGSSFVLPLWLLRSKMPGLFPVVYAKEAANIVVSSGAGGSGIMTQSEQQNDRPNAADTGIEESKIKNKALAVNNDGISDGLEAANDAPNQKAQTENEPGDDEDEEEETTCPFCLFQRRGPCGTHFRAWEKCMTRAKKDNVDFVPRCAPITRVLVGCIDSHPDYYTVQDDAEDNQQEDAASSSSSYVASKSTSDAPGVHRDQQTDVAEKFGTPQ